MRSTRLVGTARRALWLVPALAGALLLADGGYIRSKALLGQWLLERSWAAALAGEPAPRPWPWADTSPVGRLRVPQLDIDQIVLAGAAGRNLAWGPVLVAPSRPPGSGGHTVISGHRDTHFGFLERLQPGDRIELAGRDGRLVDYRVVGREIVDTRSGGLGIDPTADLLSLVTCHQTPMLETQTPFRLVVHAVPEQPERVLATDAESGSQSPPAIARRMAVMVSP